MKRFLFAPDGEVGGDQSQTAAAAPPAASTVANGPHTELANDLRRQLAEAKTAAEQLGAKSEAEKRTLTTCIAELQDELNRLRQVQSAEPAPWKYRPVKRSAPPNA